MVFHDAPAIWVQQFSIQDCSYHVVILRLAKSIRWVTENDIKFITRIPDKMKDIGPDHFKLFELEFLSF